MNSVLFRRQNITTVYCLTRQFLRHTSHEVSIYEDPSEFKNVMKPSKVITKKKFKKNPIERLFLGEFDYTLLEYPELSTQKEVDYIHHFADILGKNLNRIKEADQDESTRLTNFEYSRILQCFGLKTPKEFCGYEFSEPECAFVYEQLAYNTSLFKIISENEEFGLEVLNLFGTNEQKKKYFPKLVNGETLMCFAHHESFPISDKESLKTIAYSTAKDENFTIIGKKTLVYNANIADLIIVSALTSNEESKEQQTFFLIDKNFSGVKISDPIDVIGLNNAGFCEITFDKVVVPQDCILGKLNEGESMFKKLMSLGKMYSGIQCSAQMKSVLNEAIDRSIHTSLFKRPLNEHFFMQRKLGELISEAYIVESMGYLIAGRLYEFEDPDLFLESLIVKIYSSEALQRCLEGYLQLMDRNSYLGKNQLNEMLKTSAFHSVFDDNNDNLKLLIVETAMEYMKGKRKHRLVKKWESIQQWVNRHMLERHTRGYDAETLTWFLHPTLDEFGRRLYSWIIKFDLIVEEIIKQGKKEDKSTMRHKFLKLADIVILIYAHMAAIGRASRSYSIGLRNGDLEMKIAVANNITIGRKLDDLELEILGRNTEEQRLKNIGNRLSENYKLSHPYLSQQKKKLRS